MTLVHALPIRDLRAKVGNQNSCGGMSWVLADFEPATAFEVVNAVDTQRWDGDEKTVDFCVEYIGIGVRDEFLKQLGTLPAVRVVVRDVFGYPVDAKEWTNEWVGRDVAQQALRLSITDVW